MIPTETLNDIRSLLAARAEEVCRLLLSQGKRTGKKWKCGDTSGNPGSSLEVELEGDKAGVWNDSAAGHGGDLIALWQEARGLTFLAAAKEAGEFVRVEVPERTSTRRKAPVSREDYHYFDPDPEPAPPKRRKRSEAESGLSLDWDAAVAAVAPADLYQLTGWRGYGLEFAEWLKASRLIGRIGGQWAIPVHDEHGQVVRAHIRTESGWTYTPGSVNTPLVIGNPAKANTTLLFESQWDAYGVLDRLGHHESPNYYAAVITRGASSNTDLTEVLKGAPLVIALPQNDPPEKKNKNGRTPAEDWLHRIKKSLPDSLDFRTAATPKEFKDLNDWMLHVNPDPEQVTALLSEAKNPLQRGVIRGFSSFPTDIPPEDVLFGDGQGRVGDTGFLNSGAGMGKSVGMGQTSISFGLGLPYFGIRPSRPLKIIHFCGEDDEATIGQCREGFLAHSEDITGQRRTPKDLLPLDRMVRTDFSREFTGDEFLARLEEMLNDEHADLILINPLLSFIGGEIVQTVSKFLREGLGPILQRHRCAALIAHHTCKLNRDSWENMDFTYSGIGGGEIANIPRFILTLAPTSVKGLMALHASKRTTTGWKDGSGRYMTHAYFRRTDDPTRPAWLPVPYDEAEELISAGKASPGSGKGSRKASPGNVVEALKIGPTQRKALIERVMKQCRCSDKPARTAISDAVLDGLILLSTEPNPRGGNPIQWFCLPEHKNHGVGETTS